MPDDLTPPKGAEAVAEICQGFASLGFEVGESDIIASTKEVAQALHTRTKVHVYAIRMQAKLRT